MQIEKQKTFTDQDEEDMARMLQDATSNIYGIFFLLLLASFMLLIHIGLAYFFHNG